MTAETRRNRGRACLAAIVVALSAAAVRSQQLPPQAVFRSGVEIVLVDVTVIDRNGQPVSDLTAADFRVTVDRRPRQVASAQFMAHAVKLPPRDISVQPAPMARPPAPSPNGRDILIVIDEDSMPAGTGLVTRRAAEQFLGRLAPADRIGVATIPRPRDSITLSTNRGDARKALARVVAGNGDAGPGAYWIGISEAFDIERDDGTAVKKVLDRECRGNYPDRIDMHCVKDVLAEAHHVAAQAHLRAQRSLDALRQLADGLRQIDGPKTMVLVSGGLPMPDSMEPFSRLASALAKAQVTLYTVFVEGMQQGNPGLRQSPTPADDDRADRDGIENATSAAGGSLIRAIGTVESSFDRVATELSGSYLLGIEVDATDRDGNPHVVEVATGRRGLEVRARRQYVIPRPGPLKAGGVVAGPVIPADPASARTDGRMREVEVTPPEVEAVVARAAEYVVRYESEFSGLVAEERYQQVLSKWKGRGAVVNRELVERGEWAQEARRELRSDYLLVKAPGLAGWLPFRDVFEVDGRKVRERDERLQKLFLDQPRSAVDRANEILNESARHNIGYTRNTNLPTLALMFLHPSNRDRFVFHKTGTVSVDGTPAWQIDYRERSRPTLVHNGSEDLAAQGTFLVDASQGRVLRTTLRFEAPGGLVEIVVTYGRNEKLGEIWVPVEMRETSVTAEAKLECLAQYANFRRFQVTTDVQMPK